MDILARFDANYGLAILEWFGGIIECLLSAILRYDKYCRRDLFMTFLLHYFNVSERVRFLGIYLSSAFQSFLI